MVTVGNDGVRLRLNTETSSDSENRVKQAVQRKKDATETIAEAWQRLALLKWEGKDAELFEVAKRGFDRGDIGRLRDGQLTKEEVKEMGRRVLASREQELRKQRAEETLATKPANYFILTDDSELPALINRVREETKRQRTEWAGRWQRLGAESMTAGDFEGTGVDSYIDLSIGFSIWLPLLNEGYYLPYGHIDVGIGGEYAFKEGDPQLTRSKVLAVISPYLSHPKHGKTFHMGSARYDLHIALNDGYRIRGCVWDTLDAMHLMNEHEQSYGLKPLIQKYGKAFGIDKTVYTFEDLFGSCSPAPYNTELVGIYAINDVRYGWALFDWQHGIMQKTNRLYDCYCDIDSKLPETDVFLERCGFIVNREELKAMESEFESKVEDARKRVFATYNIDASFVRQMDRTINAKKIEAWVKAQEKRITRLEERAEKKREKIAEMKSQGKTHLKSYQQERDMLAKIEAELKDMAEPIAENAPQEIESFELTNGNHIAYLIYDFLGIEDKTKKVDRDKTRSTAADVMEMYFEDEPKLEPLAAVSMYEKLLSTYIRPMLGSGDGPSVLEVDGRLHSNFKAGGTATGRYSSSSYSGRPIEVIA